MEWAELTITSLRELGADREMVPGAMLRQRMEAIGSQSGLDVKAYVASSPSSFSQLVAEVPRVVIKRRLGSDLLVGLPGASASLSAPQPKIHHGAGTLRKDVFQAFTRIATAPFVYMPDADRFTPQDHSEGKTIKVERVSLEDLINDRRTFLSSLPPEDQAPLLAALERSPNPLSTFREQVTARGLSGCWASHQTETVRDRVVSWAKKHDITPRQAWFQQRPAISAHRTLERLIPYLTPDEIRTISIPFRAIEAFLSDERPS